MTHRPPFFSTQLSSARSVQPWQSAITFGQALMPLSKIVPNCWAVIGGSTLGLLTGPFFIGVDSAIAQPVFPNSQLTAHSHVVIEPDSSASLEWENVSHPPLQSAATNQPSSSPWGDPYTGNGTSADARREACHNVDTPLVALMPDINSGRSISSYPTFWFYVPYDSETISKGIFLLQDKEHNEVMEPLEFTLSNSTPGFVSLTFPQNVPPLKANESFHWYFELYCEDDTIPLVYVDGWIEKINLEDTALTPVLPPSSDGRLSLGHPLGIESPSPPVKWNSILCIAKILFGLMPSMPFFRNGVKPRMMD